MERRSHDTPMDFEYQNRDARVPLGSPFMTGTQRLGSFGSPSKPQHSPFRTDGLQNTLPQTPIKSHVANFRENPILDFSSGAENASSPENADNEDTPDLPRNSNLLNENVTMFRGSKSPSKGAAASSHRSSFSKYFTFPARLSPSRYSPSFKRFSRKRDDATALRRPNKRKRREAEIDTNSQLARQRNVESGYDTSRPSSSEGTFEQIPQPSVKEIGTFPAMLSFVHNHPNLPQILSYYGQTILSWFFVAVVMFGVVRCWMTIQQDVELRVLKEAEGMIKENMHCQEEFEQHGCNNRASLGRAFIPLCDKWEACMSRDAMAIARGRISAHTFAEILNEFVEPLSYKFIFVCLGMVFAMVIMPQALFGAIRKKEAQYAPQVPLYASQPMQSPFQHQSEFNEEYRTPKHNRGYDAFDAGFNAGRESPSKRVTGRESPTKRIEYH